MINEGLKVQESCQKISWYSWVKYPIDTVHRYRIEKIKEEYSECVINNLVLYYGFYSDKNLFVGNLPIWLSDESDPTCPEGGFTPVTVYVDDDVFYGGC